MTVVNQAVDQYALELTATKEHDGRWHPSQVSAPCPRSSVLLMRGVPISRETTLEEHRRFAIGVYFHRFVQDALRDTSELAYFYPEVFMEGGDVAGTADGLMVYKKPKVELLEIKSMKSAGFRYALPRKEHRIQAGTYVWLLRNFGARIPEEDLTIPPLGDKIDTMRFAYVSKNMDDRLRIEEYTERYTPELETALLGRLDYLRSLVDVEVLPKVKQTGRWYIPYCPYRGSGECCGDR